MKSISFLSVLIVLTFVLSGCATSTPLIYTPAGTMKVSTYSSEKQYALGKAYDIANKTCRKTNQQAVIIDENVTYQGMLDENVNKATKAARDIVWTLGYHKTAKAVGQTSSGQDYQVVLEFSCK